MRDLDNTDACLSEVQDGTKQVGSWQVGLEKCEQDQMVSGREKSQESVN